VLLEAARVEVMDYFQDPRSSGIWLSEYEARYIASGILLRVLDYSADIH
jgi:hypothetical protein